MNNEYTHVLFAHIPKSRGSDILNPKVMAGMFVGGMLPFLFSSFAMKAVGSAAKDMIVEVRRQFASIPELKAALEIMKVRGRDEWTEEDQKVIDEAVGRDIRGYADSIGVATDQVNIHKKVLADLQKAMEIPGDELNKQLAMQEALNASGLAAFPILDETVRKRKAILEAMRASGVGRKVPGPVQGPKYTTQTGFDLDTTVEVALIAGKRAAEAFEKANTPLALIVGRLKKWREVGDEIAVQNSKIMGGMLKIGKTVAKIADGLGRASKKVGAFAKRVRKVSRSIRAWGRNFLWLGRDITIFTSMAIGAAVKSTTMWARFAEQVTLTRRVLARRLDVDIGGVAFEAEDFITGAGIMGDVMAAADNMAISIGAATMSFGNLVRAGYDTDSALEVATQAMILNRGSMISLADATDMMITIQKNFSKELYNAARIADIMTIADEGAIATLSEIQSGMAFASGSAARLGLTLQQTAAAMVVLTNAGFSGSVAGRELRSVMNNLMQNAEDYGVQIAGAGGEMLDFDTMLSNVADRMNYFGTELERTQFLQELFGETNVSLVQSLMKNRNELKKITNELDESGGAAERAAELMKQTLEYRLDQLRTSFEKIQLAIGSGFSKALVGGEDFLGSLADTMAMIIPLIEVAAEAFGKGFVNSLTTMVGVAQTVIGALLDVADALGLVEEGVDTTTDKVGFLSESMGTVAGFALVAGPAMIAIGMALEVISPIAFLLGGSITALGSILGVLSSVAAAAAGAISTLGAALGVIAGIVGAPVWVIVLAIAAAIVILIGVVMGLVAAWDAIIAAIEPGLTMALKGLEFLLNAIWHVIEPVIKIILTLIDILIKLGMIIAGLIVILVEILEFFKVWELLGFGVAVVLGTVAIAVEVLAFALEVLLTPLKWLGDVLGDIITALFGESPGLIPGLEESTEAMANLKSEMESLDGASVTVAGNLNTTNKELETMVAHNFDSWNEAIAGRGRDVVELGADTLRALQRMLASEGEEWDWSESPTVLTAKQTTVKRPGGKRDIFGGVSSR